MTTLITIAIILLFGLCVYIESNYRHTAHKTAREMDESTKSSECYYWGEDIIVGFLLTISKWLFVSILLCILFELIMGFKDIEPILYEDYKTLWWILAAIISIGFLWYFYLETLVKRSKQINFGNQKGDIFNKSNQISLINKSIILFALKQNYAFDLFTYSTNHLYSVSPSMALPIPVISSVAFSERSRNVSM